MNKQLHSIKAEAIFWRDTIRQSTNIVSDNELERMHQALILAQNKLLVMDLIRPSEMTDCGISVAYH